MDYNIIETSKCCIVIPIYKNDLTEYEIISLKQCCKILVNYPVLFITHRDLDCSVYENICKNTGIVYKYEIFNKKYFKDISWYNVLLLSKYFYQRFIDFDYILIYQLDAFVFKNELDYWLKKGYDYIGAPWMGLNKIKPQFIGPPTVGNGGFSLRRIKKFSTSTNLRTNMLKIINIIQSLYNIILENSKRNKFYYFPKLFLNPVLKILKFIFCNYDKNAINEDEVWAGILYNNGYIPSAEEAIKFSFENYPEYLYEINNRELPFGCHDWFKYYNYQFYKNFISEENNITNE